MGMQNRVSPIVSLYQDKDISSVRDGCVTADVYSTLEKEYNCVRSSVGLSDLNHYGKIKISGDSAQDLINSLTLSDVANVPINEMQSTFILTDDGAPVCDAYVCNYGDAYLILSEGIDPANLQQMIEAHAADRYSDTHVVNQTEEIGLLGLDGPFSWELLKGFMGVGVIGIRYLEIVPDQTLEGVSFSLIRAGKSGEYGYLLLTDSENVTALWGHLERLGKEFDLVPLGYRVLDRCKLENRFVSQHNEGKHVANVLELNTRVMFSLDKGEHAGRQSLEDVMAAGVSRRVIGVKRTKENDVDATLVKGARVKCGDQTIGELVNADYSATLDNWIGLALVDADYAYVGLEYSLEENGKEARVETVSAPFIFNRSMDLRPQEESYLD